VLQNELENTINLGMQLKNEIRNLNQSEIEISQMMITRQNDLKELMEHKQELKDALDEMQRIQGETRAALEELKKAPLPGAGDSYEKTLEKIGEYSINMQKYFEMVYGKKAKKKKKRCTLMWACIVTKVPDVLYYMIKILYN